MKNLLLVLALVLFISCSEDDGPSGTRFVDDVFSEAEITFDVNYGANKALAGVKSDLYLDVYEPAGDGGERRPTIVLAHGGAFINGTKSQLKEMCEAYARKGYVVASIGYRLINDPGLLERDSVGFTLGFTESVIMAIGDMRAAIRYLRNDALNENNFGIDPEMMFAGGVSAGAVMANHVGYWDENESIPDYMQGILDDNGGFEGNTNDISQSSSVKGVVSFSGSLFDENWMDASDPQAYFVHEELDPVVPCGYQGSSLFPYLVFAYGACELNPKLTELGINSEYELLAGISTHVGYLGNENPDTESDIYINQYVEASAQFLAGIIAN
ncbi:MAG: alpha/beta hydrolase [Ekhidna sp.]